MAHGEPHPHDHHTDHAGHAHDLKATPLRRLQLAFAITASFMLIEAVVGWLSGSLALVADAGHMLSDAAALLLAILAQRVATQARTRQKTYGYRRAEVLAAFANGIALGVTALWIFAEAVRRWSAEPHIDAAAMTVTAVAGLVANVVAAWVLARGGHNANTRAALAHVLSDALGSVGAIAAGALILAFGWTRADSLISVAIGLLVLWGGYRLVRDTSRVLMESSPIEVDIAHIEDTLREIPGVVDFHDLHVWSISEGFDVLTVHVLIARGWHGTDVDAAVAQKLRERHGLEHVTIQPEPQRDDRLIALRRAPVERR